jgi:hypothetical protein
MSSTRNLFSLSPVNSNASDGVLRCIDYPNSSSKPTARHSALKELNLTRFAELTARKRELMNVFRTRRVSCIK